MVSINEIRENAVLKRKGREVTWIVWYVEKEDRIVRVIKNEGQPMSWNIKESQLKNWEMLR